MKRISATTWILTAAALMAQQPQAESAAELPLQEPQTTCAEATDEKNSFQRRHARQLRSAMENIRLGSPIEARNKQGMTALMLAAAAGDESTFNDLLHIHGAKPEAEAPGRVNLLMLAAAGGNESIFNAVQRMLPGAEKRTDTNGTPIFHYACLGGNEEIGNRLLRAGANAYALNSKGHSAILFAARGGNVNLFHTLLSRGANPRLLTRDGYDLLMAAAQGGEYSLVQTALDMGIRPDRADANGNTALMAAAANAPTDVVELLLRKGATPESRNKQGVNAAMLAAAAGNAEACLLLGGKADMPPDQAGRSLLVYAAAGGSRTLVRRLLEQGASVEEGDRLALRTAIAAGNTYAAMELAALLPDVARKDLHTIPIKTLDDAIAFTSFLAERGKNPTDRAVAESLLQQTLQAVNNPAALSSPCGDSRGRTPLQNAIAGHFHSFVVFLIEEGVDLNAKNEHGQTALMTAVETGGYDTVKILLRAGADPNLMDKSGYTATILAAEYADLAVFNLLMEHGARPDLYRRGGPTALQAAMEAGPEAQEIVNRITGRPTLPTNAAEAYTELCRAMDENNLSQFRKILKARPEPDLTDTEGNTLLMRAVSTDCEDAFAELLIEYGANVSVRNRHGFTPLIYAKTASKRALLRAAGAVE